MPLKKNLILLFDVPMLGMKNNIKNTVPNILNMPVNNPPTTASLIGYATSAPNSINTGWRLLLNVPPKITAIYKEATNEKSRVNAVRINYTNLKK